jgi:D-alanyl-D-alanine carboxypeptidase
MIRLAREALQHPQIIEWTSIEQTTFRSGTLPISNKNKWWAGFRWTASRPVHAKPGSTSWQRNRDRRLIVVVLGAESRIRRFAADKFRSTCWFSLQRQ